MKEIIGEKSDWPGRENSKFKDPGMGRCLVWIWGFIFGGRDTPLLPSFHCTPPPEQKLTQTLQSFLCLFCYSPHSHQKKTGILFLKSFPLFCSFPLSFLPISVPTCQALCWRPTIPQAVLLAFLVLSVQILLWLRLVLLVACGIQFPDQGWTQASSIGNEKS